MAKFDAIVIGAGHNGLVCAALLAKGGQKVLVVEAAASVGGFAAEREFHLGFKAAPAHHVSNFSEAVAKELSLSEFGLELSAPLKTISLGEDGAHVTIDGDRVGGVDAKDSAAFPAYQNRLKRFASVMDAVWEKTMPRIGGGSIFDALTYAQAGLKLRLLGKEDMGEFLRVLTLPMRDLVSENFDDPKLQAALCWDGLVGARMAPRSPNNAVAPLLLKMGGKGPGQPVVPKGGMRKLVGALHDCALKLGVEIRTGAPVSNIIIEGSTEGLKATGIKLQSGEEIHATRVISSADPKSTFLKLVGGKNLEIQFANRVNRLRTDGYVAKFNAALSSLPNFKGLESGEGRFIIAPDFDAIEFAFDDAKYGDAAKNPVMEITIPSIYDSELAPSGQHVLSAHVMYAPYKENTGWSDAARNSFSQSIIQTIERYAPGFADQLLHHELQTPLDLEKEYGATGGHWHHAEMALEQMLMMRPTYGAAQYATPIPGVFLCGAGSHPGGGVMGRPGLNAAREILK